MEDDKVQLKNGSTESKLAVDMITISLEDILSSNPIAFVEAVRKARDPEHKLYENVEDVLKRFGILDDTGKMNAIIKNVVKSAAEGDGLHMRFVSPIAQEQTNKQRKKALLFKPIPIRIINQKPHKAASFFFSFILAAFQTEKRFFKDL